MPRSHPRSRMPLGPRPSLMALMAIAALVATGIAVIPSPASAQEVVRTLEVEQQLLQKQIDQELTEYQQARTREGQARSQADDLSQQLDAALGGTATDDQVASLGRNVEDAVGRARVAHEEVTGLLGRILEHRQRLALIRAELERRRGTPEKVSDPITGPWRLSIEGGGPERVPAKTGRLDLELDGTEVRGTLALAEGTFGSVRGTFVHGAIDLERVSSGSGLDLIFQGDYDPATGVLKGTWHSAVMGRGEPGGGTWRAVRIKAEGNE